MPYEHLVSKGLKQYLQTANNPLFFLIISCKCIYYTLTEMMKVSRTITWYIHEYNQQK